MKSKHIVDISVIVVLSLIFLYFQYYTPPSAIRLSQKIDQTVSGAADSDRMALSNEYASYLSKTLPKNPDTIPTLGHYYVGQQRKLLDIRIKQAISEIKSAPIVDSSVRIWSMLNMGAVIKASNATIAVDTANISYVSNVHDELADIADMFLVTHTDSDHFDQQLLYDALSKNKKIVFPKGIYFEKNAGNSQNIVELESGIRTNVGDTFITAFQTDHRGEDDFDNTNCWYLIEVNGMKILHTGDGLAFKKPTESESLRKMGNIDIMMANIMLDAQNIEAINPKALVPLHLFKYVHGREQLENSTFEAATNKFKQIKSSDTRKIFLFSGESLTL